MVVKVGRPTMGDLVKTLVMINTAPEKYNQFPDRMTCVLNYALVLSTQVWVVSSLRSTWGGSVTWSSISIGVSCVEQSSGLEREFVWLRRRVPVSQRLPGCD